MQEKLPILLKVQELDIKMIRLMRMKLQKKKEFEQLHALHQQASSQVVEKEKEILEIKKDIRLGEGIVKEIQEKIQKFETQQAHVKKMDEFNSLTQEITRAGKERLAHEQKLSDLMDKIAVEEDALQQLKATAQGAQENLAALEQQIQEHMNHINQEGNGFLQEREQLIQQIPTSLKNMYERLLKNKKDRVVVPIENRVCTGCHIVLTAQHENLARKKDRLVFCEHCSRIVYWNQSETTEGDTTPKKRRRRVSNTI